MAVLAGLCVLHAAYGAYRFEDPAVLDLSAAERLLPLQKGERMAVQPLAADAAAAILAAPDHSMDAPGQVPYTDEKGRGARKQEQARIAAESAAVQRGDKMLRIKPQSGAAVEFMDRQTPARADADGDSERFFYAGRIGAGAYHRVEVLFGHDSPGSFLVNPASGKTAFVHNGGDTVVLSSDGNWLLDLDPLNAPFLLAVADLGADGPESALICHGGGSGIASVSFKGWHDDKSFDLVLTPGGQGAAGVALRIAFDGQGWRPAAADAKALEALGYGCWR